MSDQDEDDEPGQEDGQETDEWVIGHWHAFRGVELHCVIADQGKPGMTYHTASDSYQWYRWKSYHAARKFQRSHDRLKGYVIVNLSKLLREAKEQDESYERWIHRDKD